MARNKPNVKVPDQKLNEKQVLFSRLYAYGPNRGNGVQCYSEAYKVDLTKGGGYASCRSAASRLLTNDSILSYIRSLYESADLNNTVVDNELAFLIKQNSDFGSKLGAIREYNLLNSRVKNKLEISSRTFKVQIEE